MRYVFLFVLIVIIGTSCSKQPKQELTLAANDTLAISEDSLLTLVQYQTFQYFWDNAEKTAGLGKERTHMDNIYPENDQTVVTTGGSGFGIMAILVGIERGFITREQALDRYTQIVDFLDTADRFHGAWSHWIEGTTGKVKPFGRKDNGGDLVETSFLMQGLITVREYYRDGNEKEKALAAKIDKLWREIDWNWYTHGQNVLYWHWSPEYNWEMNFPIGGYNECLITYVMAASSPTHPIKPEVFVTHDQEEAMTMADRIGILSEGGLVQVGTPGEIYELPNCRFSASFIGETNLFHGRIEGDRLVGGEFPQPIRFVATVALQQGGEAWMSLRPECVRVHHRAAGDACVPEQPDDNAAPAEVAEIAYLGGRSIYHLRLPGGGSMIASVPAAHWGEAAPPARGEPVRAVVAGARRRAAAAMKARPASAQGHGRFWVGLLPWVWMLFFFVLPFALIVNVSLSTPDLAVPPYLSPFAGAAVDGAPAFRPDPASYARLGGELAALGTLAADRPYLAAYANSLLLAALTTLCCLVLGYPFAYRLARAPEAMRNLLLILVMLPFWTSFLLRV